MRWGAVILAGGRGERWGGLKQLEMINGSTALEWAVRRTRPHVDAIVLVVNEQIMIADPRMHGIDAVVLGGGTRYDSMANGFGALEKCEGVLVVDAVRCNTSEIVYRRLKRAVYKGAAGACPILPSVETVVISYENLFAGQLAPFKKSQTYSCQTPEAYRYDELKALVDAAERHVELKRRDYLFIDAMIAAGGDPADFEYVQGDPRNTKLTYRGDKERLLMDWCVFTRGVFERKNIVDIPGEPA